MYVRDARNRDEAWLLDHIEAMGLDETAFRSRDYVIAVDEESNVRAGFGRIRLHTGSDEEEYCELTSIGVLEGWRGQGVGAHVIERLLDGAEAAEFEHVYALTTEHEYLSQFGFEALPAEELPPPLAARFEEKSEAMDEEVVPQHIDVGAFEMPDRLRQRFKSAAEADESVDPKPEDTPEDFGIDPEEATYKYDTG